MSAAIQRQAFAGMLWSKQFFHYNVEQWLEGDPAQPPPPPQRKERPQSPVDATSTTPTCISMPDKWEYPWYAAWDLGFHCIPLALVDPEFAKHQLVLLGREWYQHPTARSPPTSGPSATSTRRSTPGRPGASTRSTAADAARGDTAFLERVFHKLLLNFTWWVNRKDAEGNNVFQGGFLGLDNIGVFDRSAPLPTGGYHRAERRHQLDGHVLAQPA